MNRAAANIKAANAKEGRMAKTKQKNPRKKELENERCYNEALKLAVVLRQVVAGVVHIDLVNTAIKNWEDFVAKNDK